jgi:hypothetical protein
MAEQARTAAAAYQAEHGRPISRDALGRALRVGNRAAGELLRTVRTPDAVVPPSVPAPQAGGTPAARTRPTDEAVPVPVAGPPAGNGRRPEPGGQPAPVPSSPSRPPARVP